MEETQELTVGVVGSLMSKAIRDSKGPRRGEARASGKTWYQIFFKLTAHNNSWETTSREFCRPSLGERVEEHPE